MAMSIASRAFDGETNGTKLTANVKKNTPIRPNELTSP